MKLKELFDIDELERLIDENYISITTNPYDESLKILNYTKKHHLKAYGMI